MFDWNDEELSNIIWDEAGEGEDHIVPYPDADVEKFLGSNGDCVKKEENLVAADREHAELKKPANQSDSHGVKLECRSQHSGNENLHATEFSLYSWPDLSLPSAAKTDQDTMVTEGSNNMTEISKHDSKSEDKAAPLGNTSEIFQSPLEDTEQGDFVDYGWATVGSFEDLDRIFSNEDPIFGHGSLGTADELWSPSKDVTSSPENSILLSGDSSQLGLGLRSVSEKFDVQGEYLSDQNQCFTPGSGKIYSLASDGPRDIMSCAGNVEYAGSNSKTSIEEKAAFGMSGSTPVCNLQLDTGTLAVANEFMDKGNRQKKLSKGRKKSVEKNEVRHLQNFQGWTQTGNQFLQFNGSYVSSGGQPSSSLVFSQQPQLQGSESSQYKHLSGPPLTSFMHGNIAKQYTAMPVLPQFHSGEGSYQPELSSYEVPGNLNPSTEPPNKSLTMTPQEKIEKLRRRQQMRAILAIQKQQQQFGNQISSTEYSNMGGENIEAEENLLALASFDPNSPVEQDDSNTVCVARDDSSVQDSILYQLQDIVDKLDMKIRLCIRDSLFRLAQSAVQRQYASDTSSSNESGRDKVLSNEEMNSHKRFPKMSEVETQTNPIDRTVAHLLFHRPPELTGKLIETPDPTLSAKLSPHDRKASSSMSLLATSFSQRSESKGTLLHEESEIPCLLPEEDQLKNMTGLEASENSLTIKAAGNGKIKVEPSQ